MTPDLPTKHLHKISIPPKIYIFLKKENVENQKFDPPPPPQEKIIMCKTYVPPPPTQPPHTHTLCASAARIYNV